MKLLLLLTAYFLSFSLTSAVSLHERLTGAKCVTLIIKAVDGIRNQTIGVTNVVYEVKENDLVNMLRLIVKSTNLIESVDDLTEKISHCPTLTEEEILAISPPLLYLQTPVMNSLRNIAVKKKIFDHAILGFISVSSMIKTNVQKLKKSVHCMAKQVVALSPEDMQPLVAQIGRSYDDYFDYTLNVYEKTPLFNMPPERLY